MIRAVIMAGGKGTRLTAVTNDLIPKPMALVNGKPILEHQIAVLKQNNIYEIIVVTGHLHDKIEKYFGNGSKFGVHITYFTETIPLGTGGALRFIKEQLTEDFLLLLGDVIFDLSFKRMISFHKDSCALATMFIHPNAHPYDSDLVNIDEQNRITKFDLKTNQRDYYYRNLVNAGIYVLSPKALKNLPANEKVSLEKDILFPLSEQNALYGYVSPEYVRDIGTPERLAQAEHDYKAGVIANRNLTKPQKCIFLDRDGTINKYVGLLSRAEDFVLEDCVAEAIKLVNESGYLAIVISNQPVVARNLCSIEQVEEIHCKMQTLLGQNGAYLDDVFFCPHHPNKGYPGENPIYKVPCTCRKPQTGMILAAKEKYNIDLANSWMIGDTTVDIQTGRNSDVHTVLLETGLAAQDKKYDAEADYKCKNLLEAVRLILEENK